VVFAAGIALAIAVIAGDRIFRAQLQRFAQYIE
jgi:hypothetical protein